MHEQNKIELATFLATHVKATFENIFKIDPKDSGQKVPFKLNKSQRILLKKIQELQGNWYQGKSFDRYSLSIVKARQNGTTTFLMRYFFVFETIIESILGVSTKKIYVIKKDEKARRLFKKHISDVFYELENFYYEEAKCNFLEYFGIKISTSNTQSMVLTRENGWKSELLCTHYNPDQLRGEPPSIILFDEAADVEDLEELKPAIEPTMHRGSKIVIMGTPKSTTYEGQPNILKRYALLETDQNKFFSENHHVFFSPWYWMEDAVIEPNIIDGYDKRKPLSDFIKTEYFNKYSLYSVYDPEINKNVQIAKDQLHWIDLKYRDSASLIKLNNEYAVTLESCFESSTNNVFYPKWLSLAGRVNKNELFNYKPCRISVGIDVGGVGGEGADKTIMCVNFENKYFKFFDCSVDKTRLDHYAVAQYMLNILTKHQEFMDHHLEWIAVDSAGVGNGLFGILKTLASNLSVPVREGKFHRVQREDYSGMQEYSKKRSVYRMGRDLMIDNIRQLFIKASTEWVESDDNKVTGGLGIDYESCNNRIRTELELVMQHNVDPITYTDADELSKYLFGESADHLSAMMCSVAYDFNEYAKYQKPVNTFLDQLASYQSQQEEEAFRYGYGQKVEF